jgi:transposase
VWVPGRDRRAQGQGQDRGRGPGEKRGKRKTDVLDFRAFYGVLQEMGRELRRRGVTHVVMEASGVYIDPVYYALAELDFTEVMVINPAHAKAQKGHKTAYIKPLLVQAAWAAVGVPGRIQARFQRLVRRFGGARNKGAVKRAIIAIAHTLVKIACHILQAGAPGQDLGADFCTRRESPQARQDCLSRQLQKLNPGCVIAITPADAA